MDQFVVDVGDHPVAVGDEAVLFGDPTLGVPSADEWADAAGTINYEIVTRIGPRVPRRQVVGVSGLDPLVGRHEIASPDDMEALGAQIGGMLRPGDLVVLTGPLGAGKTTLTRGIAAGLGVRGPVQSPTFVIARTHPSLVGGAPLVHVDAYRLGSAGRARRPRHRPRALGRRRGVGPRHGRRPRDVVVGGRARTRVGRARRSTRRAADGRRASRCDAALDADATAALVDDRSRAAAEPRRSGG